MQKVLPDTSFIAQWRDRIEAVYITHGHEDHIGALPWVLPALDPGTPVFAGPFAMQLVKRRLMEYNLWGDGSRFKTFEMRKRFQLGPFECEPLRVTHSIPDCSGFILRSEHGAIVHTGDWKIDEHPLDGESFDRVGFEGLATEGVALFMSDSTNVLSPGRTLSEADVEVNLAAAILGHAGRGRIVATQFASNVHRLGAVKRAADAAGRKVCFMGLSLNTYLAAAARVGLAPFDPADLVSPADAAGMDPSELLVVTTGSQAEPRAALALAAHGASPVLKLGPSDLVLYSAKVIPGNEPRVAAMMNAVAARGATIAQGRDAGLHSSGHACRGELEEVLKLVKPHHFLPVHGEFAFLCEHANLARGLGVKNTSVIRNGQMLGVSPTGAANRVAGSGLVGGRPAIGPPGPGGEAAFSASVLGAAQLTMFYNDGHRGTGTAGEMAIDERTRLSTEGVVIAAVDVLRGPPAPSSSYDAGAPPRLRARVRVTTRAMWTDEGRLLARFVRAAEAAVGRLPPDALVVAVERVVAEALRREARSYNARRPEVVVIAHEFDPRTAARGRGGGEREQRGGGGGERGYPSSASASRGAPVSSDRRGRSSSSSASRSVDGGEDGAGADAPGGNPTRGGRGGRGGGRATSATAGRGRGRAAASSPPDPTSTPGTAPPAIPAPEGLIRKRRAANPREDPAAAAAKGLDIEYG